MCPYLSLSLAAIQRCVLLSSSQRPIVLRCDTPGTQGTDRKRCWGRRKGPRRISKQQEVTASRQEEEGEDEKTEAAWLPRALAKDCTERQPGPQRCKWGPAACRFEGFSSQRHPPTFRLSQRQRRRRGVSIRSWLLMDSLSCCPALTPREQVAERGPLLSRQEGDPVSASFVGLARRGGDEGRRAPRCPATPHPHPQSNRAARTFCSDRRVLHSSAATRRIGISLADLQMRHLKYGSGHISK